MAFEHLDELEDTFKKEGFRVIRQTIGNTHYFGIRHYEPHKKSRPFEPLITNPESIRQILEDYEAEHNEKLEETHEIEITGIPTETRLKDMEAFHHEKEKIPIIRDILKIFNKSRPHVVIKFKLRR